LTLRDLEYLLDTNKSSLNPVCVATKRDRKPRLQRKMRLAENALVNLNVLLTSSTVIREFLEDGKVKVESGVYDLRTGTVTLS
jgi:carbonic anhydrase